MAVRAQALLRIDLKCNDIFNTWNPRLTIDDAGQDYRMIAHENGAES